MDFLKIFKLIMATIMTIATVILVLGLLTIDIELINTGLITFFTTITLGITTILVYLKKSTKIN